MADLLTLDSFFARLANSNPFLENRVNGPARPEIDVPDIHKFPFDRLTGLAKQACQTQRGLGAMLWGEAGIGKSHLLARLARWTAEQQGVYVYLHNLQAAPEALPRSLLHGVVSHLTSGRRNQFHLTELYALVRAAAIEATGGVAGRFAWTHLEVIYHHWLDKFGPLVGDRLVYTAFFQFFRAAHLAAEGKEDGSNAGLIVRWLAGGALDPVEARLLGMPPGRHRDDPVALEDAQQIKQVLVALSRLVLSKNKPFILALDQVDNLDEEQFAALARFAEALLDTAPNLLLVTAGIQSSLLEWKQTRVVQSSAWDRIAQTEVRLERLTPAQAEQLVRGRLEDFFTPFATVERLGQIRQQEPLFPLGRSALERTVLNQIEVRPRDVLSLMREAWQQQQARLGQLGGEAWLAEWASTLPGEIIPQVVWTKEQRQVALEERVERELDLLANRLHADPASLPSDGDQLAGVLNEVLARLCTREYDLLAVSRVPPPRRNAAPTYHLSLRRRSAHGEQVTGVLVITAGAAVAVTGFLRRLREDNHPLDRLVVVTDERVGLPLGTRGQEHLDALKEGGPGQFLIVNLTFAEHAELAALCAVLGRAKSGDLEIGPVGTQPEKLSPGEVAATQAWRRRALGHRLLRELVGEAVPQDGVAAPTLAG